MRAVQAMEFGRPDVLEVHEVPDPVPEEGQVLVDVAAADVMFLDTQLRSGWGIDFFPMHPPYIPGGAIGGIVSAVGAGVDSVSVGTRVVAPTAASGVGTGVPTGGYAEKAVAAAESVIQVPDSMNFQQAVALVHDGRTSRVVFEIAAIEPGDWVLITAAGGGLGTLLTQYAHNAGARVIAAARGAAKLELAQRLGAEVAIDYSADDWAEHARAVTGGSGPRVVFDGAGGKIGGAALSITAGDGHFIGYGAAAGDFAASESVDVAPGVKVNGLFDLHDDDVDWHEPGKRAIAEAAAGRVEVVVGQSFPLDEADRAHTAIEERAAIGRTILIM